MLTSLKLHLEGTADVKICDRTGLLTDFQCRQQAVIQEKIELPNRLTFNINTHGSLELKELWLGNIKLPQWILYQICTFTNIDNTDKITTFWNSPGTVSIDFFAPDFIQYHLIYGNKFTATGAA